MELSLWLAFFAAAWAISLSPGPGALAAMGAGLNHGFACGYWTTLGLVLGIWTQIAVVGLGLGALVATSATACTVGTGRGAAYLGGLGVHQGRAPARPLALQQARAAGRTRRSQMLRGWLVNVVNPKGTVFLLAVVPQFISLQQPLPLQYLVIALTLGFTDAVVMAGYTALAARLLASLSSPAHIRWLNRGFGGLFVAAGSALALVTRA
jgi:homoserine/homoserine lactone efflux protein